MKKLCIEEGNSSDGRMNLLVVNAIEVAQNLVTYSEFMDMSINRSLDFAKSSHGIKLSPTMSTINVVNAVNYPVECIRAIQNRLSIVVELDFAIDDHIITDGHWLKDNLICLLSNAVKYSITGDVNLRCRIVTGVDPSQKLVRFEVEDHGIGVTQLQREKLFKPFSQTQNRAGGTGLGLYALSKRIQALGGSCGIDGRTDNTPGSSVWFTFPLISGDAELGSNDKLIFPLRKEMGNMDVEEECIITTSSDDCLVQEGTTAPHKGKVLIVDDSPMVLKMLTKCLKSASYHVVVAENGAEACARCDEQDHPFDVIIIDVQMPVRALGQ
jgi:two-component system sensor histidine kinase/response regulator